LDFTWLDRFLDLMGRHGLVAILGTPTAAPPAWLVDRHPDILPVDSQGRRISFGGRHHVCLTNPGFRQAAARLVEALAMRYGADRRVAGWQIDNEMGNAQENLCHCPSCRTSFQEWLRRRHGNITQLNRDWGTVFWSQSYSRYEQVPTPAFTTTAHSPSLLLDWRRFRSGLMVDFIAFQAGIIRRHAKEQPITHNCMGFNDQSDYFAMAKALDVVGHDQYPRGFWDTGEGPDPAELAAAHALMFGLKGKPFWMLETQAGAAGWQTMGAAPRPGQLALWTMQAIAHGADRILYFRWRTCPFGTEQFWHGILPHAGTPGRRHRELSALIGKIRPHMPLIAGGSAEAATAIMFAYEDDWALKIQPHHPELDYVKEAIGYYRAFHQRNIPAAFISPDADLDTYRLVILPLQFVEHPGLVERLERFAAAGGTVLLTMRAGVKDAHNVCATDEPPPGRYSRLLGIRVVEYECLRDGQVASAMEANSGAGRFWWDEIELRGAETMAVAQSGHLAGLPAVTRHAYQAGCAWYVATSLDAHLLDALVSRLAWETGQEPVLEAQPGLECVRRRTETSEYLFVLNHGSGRKSISLPAGATVLAGDPADIPGYGFCLSVRPREAARPSA
jgi:beta-galactosidase